MSVVTLYNLCEAHVGTQFREKGTLQPKMIYMECTGHEQEVAKTLFIAVSVALRLKLKEIIEEKDGK